MRGWGGQRLTLLIVMAVASVSAVVPGIAHARKNPCASPIGSVPGRPIEVSGLDPAVTSTFAILRRSAGPEDQVSLFQKLVRGAIRIELRDFPAYIRQLVKHPDGDRYFLIPGFERTSPVPPAKCLPPEARHLRAKLVDMQHRAQTQPVYCIEQIELHRSPYDNLPICEPFAGIQTGARLVALSNFSSDVVELVPDGVASVRLIYRDGEIITAPVTNNVFDFTPPQRPVEEARRRLGPMERELAQDPNAHRNHAARTLARVIRAILFQLPPKNVEWIGAGGQTLRSFRPTGEDMAVALTVSFGGAIEVRSTQA